MSAHAAVSDDDDTNPAAPSSPLAALTDPGSVAGATLNLAIATVGAGLLTLPVAFFDAGIVLAVGTLCVVAVFTVISIRFLTQAVHKLDLHSYEEISKELLGPTFESIARYMLITYNVAVCISYIIIIGQLTEPLQGFITAAFPLLATSKHTMVFFWATVMLPMSMVRNVSSLRFSSFAAIAAAVYLALAIVYRYYVPFAPVDVLPALDDGANATHMPKHMHHGGNDVHRRKIRLNPEVVGDHPMIVALFAWHGALTMLSMPVLMFSYDCQVLVFEIYHSLTKRTVNTMTHVAQYSVAIVSVLYGTVGVFGYLSHGQYVQDNILANYYPDADRVFAVAYALYALPVVMAYTLMLFPTRDSIFNKLYGISAGGENQVSDTVFRLTSLALGVFAVAVAVVLPGMTGMIALVGGMCSSTLTMLYPAAFRFRLHSRGLLKMNPLETRAAKAMLVMGVIGFVFGTISGAVKAFGVASASGPVRTV